MNATARNLLLARVHIAKRKLGWDDESYRDNIRHLTGGTSAGDLDREQLRRVVVCFEDCLAARRRVAAAGAEYDTEAMKRKCMALAYELTRVGGRDDSRRMNRYLDSVGERMCVGGRWRMATGGELHSMIAAMEVEKRKRAATC